MLKPGQLFTYKGHIYRVSKPVRHEEDTCYKCKVYTCSIYVCVKYCGRNSYPILVK